MRCGATVRNNVAHGFRRFDVVMFMVVNEIVFGGFEMRGGYVVFLHRRSALWSC